jgi:hypothetical protein
MVPTPPTRTRPCACRSLTSETTGSPTWYGETKSFVIRPLAFRTVAIAPSRSFIGSLRKRPAAIEAAIELFRAWGREGGKKGAKARWEGVTPEQRREIARRAARARWKKAK